MGSLVCGAVDLLTVALIARFVLSFFPLPTESPLGNIRSVLTRVTEPLLAPLRRVLPPIGSLDLSAMVVIFGGQMICQAVS